MFHTCKTFVIPALSPIYFLKKEQREIVMATGLLYLLKAELTTSDKSGFTIDSSYYPPHLLMLIPNDIFYKKKTNKASFPFIIH